MKRPVNTILDAIGNTPLIRLKHIPDPNHNVYVKMEASNPGGSMKDRTARLIVSELIKAGEVARGGTIIESSSGNMAVGLAQACLYFGLKLIVVVDPKLNPHTYKLLRAYGAEIVQVNKPDPEGGYLAARLSKVKQLLDSIPNSVWSNQYGNRNNPKAYHSLMAEIMVALDDRVDYLFVATSTCGSLMGCSRYIEKQNLNTKLIAVDAVGSVLFGGPSLKREIPGHGAAVPSQFLETDKIFDVVHVNDADCIKGCRTLLQRETILAGGSSGAIATAYGLYKDRLPDGSVSVFLFADRGERYLDTIYNPDWVHGHIDMKAITRKGSGRFEEKNFEMPNYATL